MVKVNIRGICICVCVSVSHLGGVRYKRGGWAGAAEHLPAAHPPDTTTDLWTTPAQDLTPKTHIHIGQGQQEVPCRFTGWVKGQPC